VLRTNPVKYIEKTDIEWQFTASDSGNKTVGIILEGLLISNSTP
jgi:hypothetical protein